MALRMGVSIPVNAAVMRHIQAKLLSLQLAITPRYSSSF
jgi:hypothetical protein